MMNWYGHALLGRRAAQGLPKWEINKLKPDMRDETIKRPFMPEIHDTADKLGAYCLIMDWVYQDEFRKYGLLSERKWIPHGPADSEFSANGKISEYANNKLIADLLNAMILELKEENWEEAIKRAGVLGHFLQEPFTPGHSTDNELFAQLYPDPNPNRHWRLHFCFDCASDDFPPPKPELMGRTPEEAAFHIFNYIKKGILSGRALIGPVIEAAYRGKTMAESEQVRKALLCPQSEMAAFITVSAWHTAFCIAFDQFNSTELEALDICDVTKLKPYFWHPSYYAELLPGTLLDPAGNKHPMDVWKDSERNEIRYDRGFALYGYAGVKFYINGLYRKFRCKIGMPSRLLRGQTANTSVCFKVETDSRENPVFSEEIEYHAEKAVWKESLKAFEAVREIEADITGAVSLILSAKAEPYKNENGETCFDVPDLVIIEPELVV